MSKIFVFPVLLLCGLIISQFINHFLNDLTAYSFIVYNLANITLGFIMIHAGLEFFLEKNKIKSYSKDYLVATTAAVFPWLLVATYFIYVLSPVEHWNDFKTWVKVLSLSHFATPTSVGILFSMLITIGLASTWVFKKSIILAILDDLDTVLLIILLKALVVGLTWRLWIEMGLSAILLILAWKYFHKLKIPLKWKWILLYSIIINIVLESLYFYTANHFIEGIKFKVILPAFILGCIIALPRKKNNEIDYTVFHGLKEQKANDYISYIFILLVGLSMPQIFHDAPDRIINPFNHINLPSWEWILLHTILVTLISNIGKMLPLFFYKKEASIKERLALCLALSIRGEVGAGILIISIGYDIGGTILLVSMLSLLLNLSLTGLFIHWIRKLLSDNYDRILPTSIH